MTQPAESNSGRRDILGTPSSTPLMSIEEIVPGVERDFRIHKGKVRDSVDLGDSLLVVATDRISTYDVVHPNGIPDKGKILTQMTLQWLNLLHGITPNHLMTANVQEFPEPFNNPALSGRSMLVRKLKMAPIECVVRGYITGSAMAEYRQTGAVCGIKLSSGLIEAQKLDNPIFTPATKATVGHDENIDFERMVAILNDSFADLDADALAQDLKEKTLKLYTTAADYAKSRGIIIADTKFEFGLDDEGRLVLADEVLTPDSSRFWDVQNYTPGGPQDSLDKQFVRNYVLSIGWNREPPAPMLPPEIVSKTYQRYAEAYRRLFV